jgi:hypothetical protein
VVPAPCSLRGRRRGGPRALAATATWLRRAFGDIRFEVHEIAFVGDRAVAWVTPHATNTRPFVVHDAPDGSVTQVFPPTGRQFAARQVHWFRIEDEPSPVAAGDVTAANVPALPARSSRAARQR